MSRSGVTSAATAGAAAASTVAVSSIDVVGAIALCRFMMVLPVVTQKVARPESRAHTCGKVGADDVAQKNRLRWTRSECSPAGRPQRCHERPGFRHVRLAVRREGYTSSPYPWKGLVWG